MAEEIRSVESTVVVGSAGVAVAGFGTQCILGTHSVFPERFRLYSSTKALAADFATDSPEYIAGARALGQILKPDKVMIGRRDATGAVAQVDTGTIDGTGLADGDQLSFEFEGDLFTSTYEAADPLSPTLTEWRDQVVAELNDLDWPIDAAAGGLDGEFTITMKIVGQPFDITTPSANVSFVTSTANTEATESVTDALTAIAEVATGANDFYGVTLTTWIDGDITDATEWVNTRERYFGGVTNEAGAIAATTTDIGATLKGLLYQKAFVFYHHKPWTFPAAALMGNRLSVDPDDESTTWNLVQLVGIETTELSETEIGNLENKNYLYYISEGGVGVTHQGKAIGGEWIDVMIGIDWFNARLRENTFRSKVAVVNAGRKVPYTDDGIAALEGILRGLLRTAKDTNFIAEIPEPTITAPVAAEVASATKAARELPPITWKATLAGAIHFTEFTGELIP